MIGTLALDALGQARDRSERERVPVSVYHCPAGSCAFGTGEGFAVCTAEEDTRPEWTRVCTIAPEGF